MPTATRRSARLFAILGLVWLALAAALLAYQFLSPARVEVTWETATEQNTVGFNLYRSQSPEGDFVLVNEGEFIASQGGPVSGASYSYTDTGVAAGQTYYYVLEEIESDGSRIRYEDDLFAYEVPGVTWWLIVLAVASAAIGLAMLAAARREEKTI